MQTAQHQPVPAAMPIQPGVLAPASMAAYLRRNGSTATALCFARAMHEGSAWANEGWGRFWAEVMAEV